MALDKTCNAAKTSKFFLNSIYCKKLLVKFNRDTKLRRKHNKLKAKLFSKQLTYYDLYFGKLGITCKIRKCIYQDP